MHKSQEKFQQKLDTMREEIEDVVVHLQTKEDKKFKEIKEYMEMSKSVIGKEYYDKLEHQKGETERQLNEMCSMFEDLAKLVKQIEWQM